MQNNIRSLLFGRGVLAKNSEDTAESDPVLAGILARYPYLTEGNSDPFMPNQQELIAGQLEKGFGPTGGGTSWQDRVAAPYSGSGGGIQPPEGNDGEAKSQINNGGGRWYVRHPSGHGWLANGSIGPYTPGARQIGGGGTPMGIGSPGGLNIKNAIQGNGAGEAENKQVPARRELGNLGFLKGLSRR